jgi:hypothetical protein
MNAGILHTRMSAGARTEKPISLIPNDVMAILHAGDTKGALQILGFHDETPNINY